MVIINEQYHVISDGTQFILQKLVEGLMSYRNISISVEYDLAHYKGYLTK